MSRLIATLWLPTSAALVGHLGLFSWPRGIFHGPAVSALIICPPALYRTFRTPLEPIDSILVIFKTYMFYK